LPQKTFKNNQKKRTNEKQKKHIENTQGKFKNVIGFLKPEIVCYFFLRPKRALSAKRGALKPPKGIL
jgi:hypothetical protein